MAQVSWKAMLFHNTNGKRGALLPWNCSGEGRGSHWRRSEKPTCPSPSVRTWSRMGSFGIVAPSPGVCTNCTCPSRPNHWLGETTENNNDSCLTSTESSVSQVHANFLALPHFIHYLISSSKKNPYEVDIIHPILPEVRKIKWPTQKWLSPELCFLMGTLTALFPCPGGVGEGALRERGPLSYSSPQPWRNPP